MNLLSFVAPYLQKALQKPLQKAVTWAYRQDDGKAHGDAVQAENAPVISAAENAATGVLTQAALSKVGAAHVTNDKIAKMLGIPTTEEGLLAAVSSQAGTLDLSNPGALAGFLASNIVK